MNTKLQLLAALMLANLLACSSQPTQKKPTTQIVPETSKPDISVTAPPPVLMNQSLAQSGQNPPMKIQHGKKSLGLVRIMDGGVCKNPQQGTKGSFLIYADLEDIKTIKKNKGEQIFRKFDAEIQSIAAEALQTSVGQTNLAKDPFVLDNDEAQAKLSGQLAGNFQNAIAAPIKEFTKGSGLSLDIVPFQSAFVFFQEGCDARLLDQDTPR